MGGRKKENKGRGRWRQRKKHETEREIGRKKLPRMRDNAREHMNVRDPERESERGTPSKG